MDRREDASTWLAQAVGRGVQAPASSGGNRPGKTPYMARDPVASLFQSGLERSLRDAGLRDHTPSHRDPLTWLLNMLWLVLHPVRFGPTDADWVVMVGAAMLDRLARGNHAFNPNPARHEISDDARILVVGDWGSGVPRAREVARHMAREVAEGLAADREVHVIHLGDVYYSGLEEEVREHVLAPGMWPVTAAQAEQGVTSWSLNGNHDMYGGGYGYFDTLLRDPRFRAQRSTPDNQPTSFFRLTSPSWDLLGLDTSWDEDVLSTGMVGVLESPQAKFVEDVAGESQRRLVLLSHHQLLSAYDPGDIGPTLAHDLAPVLNSGRVTAWLWGHEHRLMAFEPRQGVKFPRCVGHGGVPTLMEHAENDPVPEPGLWEERHFFKLRGDHWARFGFAVLDLSPQSIAVRYVDERGELTHEDTIE
ncbi:MAG TPA: metallophosphoesterase [Solirubrobacteraceae bacterium]|nr:metallophosphoesterase [Solirubrobacteraceae bacterium]